MRELMIAVVLLTGGLAGCLAGDDETTPTPPADDGADDRVPPETWTANLSEARYDGITSTVHELTAEDGTRLSLSVHLPEDAPSDATFPTLLVITPYQSFGSPHQSTPLTGTGGPSPGYASYVERGAVVVVADARGTGGSGGCLDFGGPLDRSDARVFVDWIRQQGFSNGTVVTDGVSHPGMGSLVAHVAEPTLDGALAHAPVVSYYRDEWYQGAKFEDQLNGPLYQAVETSPPLYDDPDALAAQVDPCYGSTAVDFGQVEGPFTETWAKRDLSRYTENASQTPLLLTQGFIDVNVHPDHAQAYWEDLPEDAPAWLVMGFWYHGYPDMEGYGVDGFEEIRHRWLDALLFERDNDAFEEPKVLVEDDTGDWHESPTWPLDGATTLTFNATPDGGLATAPADEGGVTYPDDPDAERRAWGEAKALFTTEPLEQDTLVNGAPTVKLVASSTEDATKWVAYLVELTPDGEMLRVSHGYADSHTHAEEGTWQPIAPGEPYTWTIELMPTAVRVEAGHQLGLLIASQDSRNTDQVGAPNQQTCWPHEQKACYAPSGIVPAETAGRAENTVHTGPGGTSVTLSWIEPDQTQTPPWS